MSRYDPNPRVEESQPLEEGRTAEKGLPQPSFAVSTYPDEGPAAVPSAWQLTPRLLGLLLGIVAAVALLLGVALGSAWLSDGIRPGQAPTSVGPDDIGLPTALPTQPGIEPPRGRTWPNDWATFGPTDRTKKLDNLPGLGFSFRVPEDWSCRQAARTEWYAKYTCGASPEGQLEIGGDLIVRLCEKPCDEDRQTRLRKMEEAWGLHWTRSGPFTVWAESTRVNGDPRYGLVYVSYWRSVRHDALDRQLVFRMTAPIDRADELRKVINSIRDKTFTI